MTPVEWLWQISLDREIQAKDFEQAIEMEKQQQVTKCDQMATNSSQPQTIIGEHSIQMLEISDEEIKKIVDETFGTIRTEFDMGIIHGMKLYREQLKNK